MLIRKVYVLSEPTTVRDIAMVYQNTFGGDPWNEGYVCPKCKQSFPLSTGLTVCPECLKNRDEIFCLVEYWPLSKIVTDFYLENSKEEALCLVAQNDQWVVGFVWGYGVMINTEFADKIEAPELVQKFQREVFYLDECAVLPKYQKQGTGKSLIKEILKRQPYDIMILRTLEGSQMQSLIESLGGEKILTISEGRIIMKLIKVTSLYKFVTPDHY